MNYNMDTCPRCNSKEIRKDGVVKNKQRFKCKVCNYHFTVVNIGKPANLKRIALLLYLLGFNYRQTGLFLSVSHVTVYQWISQFGELVTALKGKKPQKLDIEILTDYIGVHNNKDVKDNITISISDGELEVVYSEN